MTWTPAEAERYLDGLQPIGWKLGLERMHRLTSLLGMPQHRFASIHVVGTNGKSSVARMAAALVQATGTPSGACVSPHLTHWSQRTWIRGSEVEPDRFARAVQRTAEAATVVDRTLPEGEAVTQFEAATASSFVALAGARVRVAAIEAGLGGRLDATNVLPSQVTVLTSVGLDHTEWLGTDEKSIAAEKLAVLRDGSTLVLGAVSDEVRHLAEETAAARGARLMIAPEDPGPEIVLGAAGGFQRRNFAVARAAVAAVLGPRGDSVAAEVAAEVRIPGRLEVVGDDPLTLIDAAHNPQGMRALAEALPGVAEGRPVIACVAVMAEKDARGILSALAPAVSAVVATEPSREGIGAMSRPGSRAHGADELARICADLGTEAEAVADAAEAVRRARELARAREGIAIVTGSNYLLETGRRVGVKRS